MKGDRGIALGALVACGLIAGSAAANPMRSYVFEGKLTEAEDPMSVFNPSVQVGGPFRLTVTLPADTPNDLGGSSQGARFGHYLIPSGTPDSGFTLEVAGQSILLGAPGDGIVSVTNGNSFYGHQLFGPIGGRNVSQMMLQFTMYKNGQVLQSTALPDVVDPTAFDTVTLYLAVWHQGFNSPGTYSNLAGAIQEVTVLSELSPAPTPPPAPTLPPAPIPEPTTLATVAVAFTGLIGARRARSRWAKA